MIATCFTWCKTPCRLQHCSRDGGDSLDQENHAAYIYSFEPPYALWQHMPTETAEYLGFGSKTAGGTEAGRKQWMPDRFFERSISTAPERIFLQLKSIWREMFSHLAPEKF
jgi:hypothetical protein